jgi:hypothetical protein
VAALSGADPLARGAPPNFIAVADLQAGRDGRSDSIALCACLPADAITRYLGDEVVTRTAVYWAPASKAVVAKRQRLLGSLVLSEEAAAADDARALPVLLKVWLCVCVCVCVYVCVCERMMCMCVHMHVQGRVAHRGVAWTACTLTT